MTKLRCHVVRRNTRIERNLEFVRSAWRDSRKTPEKRDTNIVAKLADPNSNRKFAVLHAEHIAFGQAPVDNAARVAATQYNGCLHSRKTRRTMR